MHIAQLSTRMYYQEHISVDMWITMCTRNLTSTLCRNLSHTEFKVSREELESGSNCMARLACSLCSQYQVTTVLVSLL